MNERPPESISETHHRKQILDKDFVIGKQNLKITRLESTVTMFSDKLKQHKSMVEDVKDALSRMICFDVCGDVCVLPCGHVGCQLCLVKWFSGMGLVDPHDLQSTLGTTLALPFCSKSCPTCKVPFNSLPTSGVRFKNIAESMGIMVPAPKLSYSEQCTWLDMFPAAASHPDAPSREQLLADMIAARREGHAAILREQAERAMREAGRLAREQTERREAEAERARAIANDPAERARAIAEASRTGAARDREFVSQTMAILNRGFSRQGPVALSDTDFGNLTIPQDRTTRAERAERAERTERALIHELHTRLPNFDGSGGLPGGADPRLPVTGPLQRQQADAFRRARNFRERDLDTTLVTGDGRQDNVAEATPAPTPAPAPAGQPQRAARPTTATSTPAATPSVDPVTVAASRVQLAIIYPSAPPAAIVAALESDPMIAAAQPEQGEGPAAAVDREAMRAAWTSVVIPPFPPAVRPAAPAAVQVVLVAQPQQTTRPATVAPYSWPVTRAVVTAPQARPAARPVAPVGQLPSVARRAAQGSQTQQATRPAAVAAAHQPTARAPAATPAAAPAAPPSTASLAAPHGPPERNYPPLTNGNDQSRLEELAAAAVTASGVRSRGRARASPSATAPDNHPAPATATAPAAGIAKPMWQKAVGGLVAVLVIAVLMPKVGWADRILAPVYTFFGTSPA